MSLLQEIEKHGLAVCPDNMPYIQASYLEAIKTLLGAAVVDFEIDMPVLAAEHVLAAHNLLKAMP